MAAPRDGEYFAAVTTCCRLPDDPFEPTAAGSPAVRGEYVAELSVGHLPWTNMAPGRDADVFHVELRAGDVLVGSVSGAAGVIGVVPPSGYPGTWSTSNVSDRYTSTSPLRHTGDIGVELVAHLDGVYAVVVQGGFGDYEGELRVLRSPAETADVGPQIVFLDTDGADVDLSTLAPKVPSPAGLDPLAQYLSRWGLGPADEAVVVDTMVEQIEAIFAAAGADEEMIEFRSSDRDPGPRGEPDVSRVILGGSSSSAAGLPDGIVGPIDPGNMDREETAVVLLDPLATPDGRASINRIPLAPDASKAELVGVTLGALAAREVGHLLGLWETDTVEHGAFFVTVMDRRADPAELIGGEDGVWGTEDDPQPWLGQDGYAADGPYGYDWGFQPVHARILTGLAGSPREPETTDDGDEPVDSTGTAVDADAGRTGGTRR